MEKRKQVLIVGLQPELIDFPALNTQLFLGCKSLGLKGIQPRCQFYPTFFSRT